MFGRANFTNEYLEKMKKSTLLTPTLKNIIKSRLSQEDYANFVKLTDKMDYEQLRQMFNNILLSRCIQINTDDVNHIL